MMDALLSLAVVLWVINAVDAHNKAGWQLLYITLATFTLLRLVNGPLGG